MSEKRRYRICAPPLLAFATMVAALAVPVHGQGARPAVYLVPIEGMIDLGLAPFVQRVLDEATGAKAGAVVLEINTFGGRVDAAVLIRDALLRSRVRTVAFVNKRALAMTAVIGFVQERKAERSVRGLMPVVAPHARVIRGGRESDVESRQLVPGDLVLPARRRRAGHGGRGRC